MRGVHLDQLRAFAEVIELGSFTAAGEPLSLTRPAVSQQVRQFERRFKVPLIERIGSRATPTPLAER
jgi:DNA-binding transcriptional LysR family regulator